MQLVHLVDLKLKDFQVAASKKRLIATLKCCCRCQQLSRQLLVLFGELGHAVIGPRWLVAFGFGRLFHDEGIAVKPGEFVGQCNELIVGCSDPNFVQIGHVSHHAINDGMWVIDALGGKLLHVLIDLRCKSAKFIHAHALLTLSGAQFLAKILSYCRNVITESSVIASKPAYFQGSFFAFGKAWRFRGWIWC